MISLTIIYICLIAKQQSYLFDNIICICRNMRQLKYINKFHPYNVTFKRHCKEGKLPNYVVIEQRYLNLKLFPGNDDHPSHDVANGQRLVKEVYEALRSSPQWHETLLVITYDEHGGFFDHVPTPVEGVPSPDGIVSEPAIGFTFDRLGVRVPALFVSPWIEPGTVIHRPSGPEPTSQYEHSSIPATVKKIFGLKEFLTKRDAWAGTFESVLTRATPRTDCPEQLPEPVRLRSAEEAEDHGREISEFQAELVELAAALKGDHATEAYDTGELVKGMTVAEAADYCHGAFAKFREECQRCHECGMDGCHVPTVQPVVPTTPSASKLMCSCLPCFNA
jgi:phospholipase C